jgi:hypothetical protein
MNDDSRPGMCAAYGCPLFGSMGNEGKWFCFCHVNRAHVSNDVITSTLKAHMHIVNATIDIRRWANQRNEWSTVKQGIAKALRAADRNDLLPADTDITVWAWLSRLEMVLIDLTGHVGEQRALPNPVPTAHVVGPTHATEHYSEQTSRLVEQA